MGILSCDQDKTKTNRISDQNETRVDWSNSEITAWSWATQIIELYLHPVATQVVS